jgi:RHS repeat-associated protein
MQVLFLFLAFALQISPLGCEWQDGHTVTGRSIVIDNAKVWLYKWNANGSLKEVTRPDKKKVQFEYDALRRRTVKTYDGKVTRWVWDGNTPLHEWIYDEKERPKIITDEFGLTHKEGTEPVENITTWVFEEGSFRPSAKLTDEKKYSIIADYLGTPVQMYDEKGKLTWEARLDVYGKVGTFAGSSLSDCPFRYQGQYHDAETDLYYNRFRYYDPDNASYLSQDPIGLMGNNPTFYGYVKDVNSRLDQMGLMPWPNPVIKGHHLVYKQKANSVGLSHLGTDYDTPTFHFNKDNYVPGMHERMHKAQDRFVGGRQGKFNGTADELLEKSRKGLVGIDDLKGDLKIPRTGEVLAKDVMPLEAYDKLMEWHKRKIGCQ